ncbi:MAG: hypothetical protein MUF15_13880 [Acidobacteria bacterium]|jgi:ABC-type transport system involved in cytochrome c biogenesis ATPase subunit|nr:hypothetical protein [Acidobacteriota bacterium]
MPKFRAIFFKDYKRFICKRNIIILAVLILLLQYSVHKEIRDCRDFTIKSKEFQANEASTYRNMVNYTNISSAGITILFLPAATGILFTHPPFMTELSANINTIVKFDIKNNCQGKSLFTSHSIFKICFANILLLLGSLASLVLAVDTFHDKTYLKSLCSLGSSKKIFANVLFSRFILIVINFLLILVITLAHIFFKGFFTAAVDITLLTTFSLTFIVIAAFFFLVGIITALVFSLQTKMAFTLVIWIIFAWLIPAIFQTLIINKAESISSNYKLYNDKMTIVNDFEKKSIEEKGTYTENTKAGAIYVIENYWKNYFTLIQEKDDQFKKQMEGVINQYYTYFMWTPTTFYYAVSDSLSSRGYNNYLAFSDYIWHLRRQFVRFWIDRVYYNDPRHLVPFIKDDENLFKARSRLPKNFIPGLLINIGYNLILLGVAFFCWQKYLYTAESPAPVKANNLLLTIAKGAIKTLWVPLDAVGFRERLYNLFSGKYHIFHKNEPPIKIKIGDSDYTENRTHLNFCYICHPAELPAGMKVMDFITFNFRLHKIPISGDTMTQVLTASRIASIKNRYIGRLNIEERGRVLLAILPGIKRDLYLVDTVTTGMSLSFTIRLNEIMKDWAEKGSSVLFLTQEREVKLDTVETLPKDMNFHEQDMWSKAVSRLKELGYDRK